jgi:hypothetical protein
VKPLVAILLEPVGTAAAFAIGLVGTLALQLVVLVAQRDSQRD